MPNDEIQKAMESIVEIQKQSATKKVRVIRFAKSSSEKRWKRTEVRLHALLSHARKRNRGASASPHVPGPRHVTAKPVPLHKTATEKRLGALTELVERQISERRNGNS